MMTPPLPLYHALLRPAVLQILRATGFHSAKPSVLDSLTDVAARYFLTLCQTTARFASHNSGEIPLLDGPADANNGDQLLASAGGGGSGLLSEGGGLTGDDGELAPTIVNVRMALQHVGALLPEKMSEQQHFSELEDMRGLEAFLAWVEGAQNQEIKRVALDGDLEAVDYLDGEFLCSCA